jgi:hypothetical protein
VTVYKPVGDFITGGGYIRPTQSAGTYASDPGKRTNFGFNVKYNNKGTNLKGNMNIIFRRTVSGVLHTYQIKSNAIQSLGVNATNPNAQTAQFVAKANLQDITNPLAPVSLGGNLGLHVNMIDHGEPGTNDSISIVLTTAYGVDPTILANLLYTSNWVSSQTQQMGLSGGNLVVHSGFNLNPTITTVTTKIDEVDKTAPAVDLFQVKAWPNPTEHHFTLITGSNTNEVVEVRIFDISGKQLKLLKARVGEAIQFGDDLTIGAYIAEIRQGNKRKMIKLIKQ